MVDLSIAMLVITGGYSMDPEIEWCMFSGFQVCTLGYLKDRGSFLCQKYWCVSSKKPWVVPCQNGLQHLITNPSYPNLIYFMHGTMEKPKISKACRRARSRNLFGKLLGHLQSAKDRTLSAVAMRGQAGRI